MTDKETTTTSEAAPHSSCFCMGAGPELSQVIRKIGPGPAAQAHFRSARIEFLKGIRQLIEDRIERLSRPEKKGTKVNVE